MSIAVLPMDTSRNATNAQQSVAAFIAKWRPGGKSFRLGERSGAQIHFLELCELLGVETPDDPDNYCFERGFKGITGGVRFADAWKRGFFAWEYKQPGGNLRLALDQLMHYALPLDNPPLLVVSDRTRVEIHTHFTGYPSKCTVIAIEELADPKVRTQLREVFLNPYSFKPEQSSREVTESAATAFTTIADILRGSGIQPQQTAHFLSQCVFCYFAEDIGLLPRNVFKRLLSKRSEPAILRTSLRKLFETMRKGGAFGADDIPWFNGGLFNHIEVPLMPAAGVHTLADVAELDWSAIDPSIFGTLFERGLDPGKRSQLGAFYTSPAIILRLIEPVIQRPLLKEWEECKAQISGLLSKRDLLRVRAKGISSKSQKLRDRHARFQTRANRAAREAKAIFDLFLERLKSFKILDPACGSGNFLYLALKMLKDIERQANLDAESLGLEAQLPVTGPHNVRGIEISEYAAELARMTIWIGELQWRKQNGYGWKLNPVLEALDHIECRDALIYQSSPEDSAVEAPWPAVSVIVGNPPFVGNKKMRDELGADYTQTLRQVYGKTLPGSVDLVCYWFDKALKAIKDQGLGAAGLVTTQSVRHGSNRVVLDAICSESRIFEAWSDEPWVNNGAAVRVSLVCFGLGGEGKDAVLDGESVPRITADLGGRSDINLTEAKALPENSGMAFQGPVKVGPFDIPGYLARQWLLKPNASGALNSVVLRPWANGQDIARRNSDTWIIDFGATMTEAEASKFEEPFSHVMAHVKPMREAGNRDSRKKYWWLHGETVPSLRARLKGLKRYIATPRVSKHRFFVWLPVQVWPDSRLYAITRDDDFTFGVLSSRIHEVWSLANASMHGVGNDPTYNAKSCFETFPFPNLSSLSNGNEISTMVSSCAAELDRLRTSWLSPPEWTEVVAEMIPIGVRQGPYPPRVNSKPEFKKQIAERTMTNLYNRRPAWLNRVHKALDLAVARAYGWADYSAEMDDAEILRRLAALNIARIAPRLF